jgi:hypothetical protein
MPNRRQERVPSSEYRPCCAQCRPRLRGRPAASAWLLRRSSRRGSRPLPAAWRCSPKPPFERCTGTCQSRRTRWTLSLQFPNRSIGQPPLAADWRGWWLLALAAVLVQLVQLLTGGEVVAGGEVDLLRGGRRGRAGAGARPLRVCHDVASTTDGRAVRGEVH